MADWLNILCSVMFYYINIVFKKADGNALPRSLENNSVFHRPCDISQSFSVVYWQSFENCFLDCVHQSTCEVIMVSHRTKQCALFDAFVTNKTFVNSNSICLYMKIDKSSAIGGSGRDPQCGPLEKIDMSRNRCVNARCPIPTAINHSIILFTSTFIGTSARYKCKTGYFGKGNPKIECQQNTSWSFTNFSCTSTTCPEHISIENADPLESTLTKVGSKAKYKCKAGFYSLGIPEIHCQLNATWVTQNFSCTDKKCPPETYIAGAQVYSTGRFIGAVAHYECTQDYLASGFPEIRCLENTSWTFTIFTCEQLCPAPKPVTNAELLTIVYPDNSSLFREGTQINYSCYFDYYGESDATTTVCGSSGIWNPERVVCCKNGTISDGKKCFRSFPIQSETSFYDIDGICASYDFEFVSTSQYLYNILADKGSYIAPLMLYRRTKKELQADLYMYCLSIHMNTTQLEDYANATYEETRQVIQENGWDDIEEDGDTANFCKKFLINYWQEGQPNGGVAHQCIVIGPSTDMKYDDIDCNNFDHELLGFTCMYNTPYVAD